MKRAEQREQTRLALVRAATARFAADGYATASLPGIVADASVTKGALYHHFDSKLALFRAVVAEAQAAVGEDVAEAADAQADPWQQLLAGCRAYLVSSTRPSIRRIMHVDGPAVLGWREWRELDEANSARHLQEALAALVDQGVLAKLPLEPATRLLSGGMNEAALWLAESSCGARDLDDAMLVLERMLTGLRP